MRTLTEADLRASLVGGGIKEYSVPPDVFVTPLAREYLAARGIKLVVKSNEKTCFDETRQVKSGDGDGTYVDALTGKKYAQKPEDMTHLRANFLVRKTNPVIAFRGQLDALEAEIISAQVHTKRLGREHLTDDLQQTLVYTREILGAEVKDVPLKEMTLLGLSQPELRRVSHDIKAELGLKKHPVPEYTMGELPALINALRTRVRSTELCAATAVPQRFDIITALNRLSSAMHIIFCRLLTGYYD